MWFWWSLNVLQIIFRVNNRCLRENKILWSNQLSKTFMNCSEVSQNLHWRDKFHLILVLKDMIYYHSFFHMFKGLKWQPHWFWTLIQGDQTTYSKRQCKAEAESLYRPSTYNHLRQVEGDFVRRWLWVFQADLWGSVFLHCPDIL